MSNGAFLAFAHKLRLAFVDYSMAEARVRIFCVCREHLAHCIQEFEYDGGVYE